MRKIALACAIALMVSGCANFQNAWDTLTGAKVSPNAVYVAANTADSGEVLATAYLRACHKAPSAYAACSKSIEVKVVDAVRAVRTARNNIRAFLVAHPDALGASGLYDALIAAQQTLSTIINDYNLAQVKS